MTILESLQWANNKLKKASFDSPMLDAEILLAHVLDLPRARLFSHVNDPVKSNDQERFLLFIERRSKHEPIAYLTHKKMFYGREFIVNPSVLIPRPATETLVELALDKFETIQDKNLTLFADIGTGSGAIGITIAAESHAPVIASDVSSQALSVAKQNVELQQVQEWIGLRQGDLLSPLCSLFVQIRIESKTPVSSVFPFKHLIVCANLPYLTLNQMETLQKDVSDYEPHLALESGADGLNAYWNLFKQLKKERARLPRHVCVLIEIDPMQADQAVLMIKHPFPQSQPQIKKDLSGLDRVIMVDV